MRGQLLDVSQLIQTCFEPTPEPTPELTPEPTSLLEEGAVAVIPLMPTLQPSTELAQDLFAEMKRQNDSTEAEPAFLLLHLMNLPESTQVYINKPIRMPSELLAARINSS
jgi:hypothetical protein